MLFYFAQQDCRSIHVELSFVREYPEQEQDQYDGESKISKCEARCDGELLESLCQLVRYTPRVISRQRFQILLLERTQSPRDTVNQFQRHMTLSGSAQKLRRCSYKGHRYLQNLSETPHPCFPVMNVPLSIGGDRKSPTKSSGHKKEIAFKRLLHSTPLPIKCLTMKM